MVDRYSINSTYFKKIGNIFHKRPVHPRPYRIVRIALAALFIYAGVTQLCDLSGPGLIGLVAVCLCLSRRVWEYHENQ
ncbi:MAG: hypothetical protein C0390_05170 [Syntrophus sp. (in: bacteria)]|nr:hypothetical protein [Syntrophus sp. (in: bacteria)]